MGEACFLAILGEPRPTRLPKVVIKRLPQLLGDPGIEILAKKSGAYWVLCIRYLKVIEADELKNSPL